MSSSAAAAPSGKRSAGPIETLFCSNLNVSIKKEDMRRQLYMLFSVYGTVLEVQHSRNNPVARSTAYITFRDVNSSTNAMRSLQGFEFCGRDLKIEFAKKKSDFIAKLEGTYKPSSADTGVQEAPKGLTDLQNQVFGGTSAPAPAKRAREEEEVEKKEEKKDDEDDDEEMEMELSDSE